MIILLSICCLLIVSCNNEKITRVKIPKQKIFVAKLESTSPLHWVAANHWQQQTTTSEFVKESYNLISTTNPQQFAAFTISSFQGDTGGILANVNRWRNQLQLSPINDSQLEPLISHQDINQFHFDIITITNDQSSNKETILAAIQNYNNQTYFYKLRGPLSIINAEKSNFMTFLNSINNEHTQ